MNDGNRAMKCNSFEDRDDNEYNDVGFVDISRIFGMQVDVFLWHDAPGHNIVYRSLCSGHN